MKSLLDEDPTLISSSDEDGYTPLHRACYNNHTGVVDLLLSRDADVTVKTQMQWQPLHSCCQWNHKDCAIRLIQHGADVNASSIGGVCHYFWYINLSYNVFKRRSVGFFDKYVPGQNYRINLLNLNNNICISENKYSLHYSALKN